jgi:hypothetical protein
MKKYIILILAGIFASVAAYSQTWFDRNVKIGQSMETAELKSEPAQFQFTIPQKDSSSWLINLGVSVKIKSNSARIISRAVAEYHKNTLTDKKQNNLSAGYNYTWFVTEATTSLVATGDVKYVFDGIKEDHSLAANILFAPYNDDGAHWRWNAEHYFAHDRQSITVSPFGGVQLQQIFKAENDSSKGFIARPVFSLGFRYSLNNKQSPVPDPVVSITTNYTGRYDAVNTSDFSEGYTYLFNAGAEYIFVNKPLKASIGFSFNYGSDPLKGLAQQRYWLVSLNISKK